MAGYRVFRLLRLPLVALRLVLPCPPRVVLVLFRRCRPLGVPVVPTAARLFVVVCAGNVSLLAIE